MYIESWQTHRHRLLQFRLDVVFAATGAVLRHLDNVFEFGIGFFLLEQVLFQNTLQRATLPLIMRRILQLD